MQLTINEIYKVCIGEDIELNNEYEYFICIGEREEYYILHEFNRYVELNGLGYPHFDLDEEFIDKPELDFNYYKRVNDLESIYYKNKEVNHNKPKESKRKFIKV